MIYAEIWASKDEGAAEAMRLSLLMTEAQHNSFERVAHGNGTIKGAKSQADDLIKGGEYKAVRVFRGKSLGLLMYEIYADINQASSTTTQ